jgi:hypothetical protein
LVVLPRGALKPPEVVFELLPARGLRCACAAGRWRRGCGARRVLAVRSVARGRHASRTQGVIDLGPCTVRQRGSCNVALDLANIALDDFSFVVHLKLSFEVVVRLGWGLVGGLAKRLEHGVRRVARGMEPSAAIARALGEESLIGRADERATRGEKAHADGFGD